MSLCAIAASNLAAVSWRGDVYGGYAKPNPDAINSRTESKRDPLSMEYNRALGRSWDQRWLVESEPSFAYLSRNHDSRNSMVDAGTHTGSDVIVVDAMVDVTEAVADDRQDAILSIGRRIPRDSAAN